MRYMSSGEPYFRQFCNLARKGTRHSRSNGATGTLKPRFTRTGEKLGKAGKSGAGGYASVFSPGGDRFSFRYKRPETAREPRRKGEQEERDPERTLRDGRGVTWVGRERRSFSIESASSPQMQLNRTCRREVHLTVLLVSSRFRLRQAGIFTGRLPCNNRGDARAGRSGLRTGRKRDLRRKGREFTFLRAFRAVKTNIADARSSGAGQRISSQFAGYERDQVPSHSDAAVRGRL